VIKIITLSVSLHLLYVVKHKMMLDKQCSIVRHSLIRVMGSCKISN